MKLFKKKLSRLKVPHSKHTSDMASVRIAPPKEVLIPLSMHSGAPAEPVVKVGDAVRIGQLIAQEGGPISAPVHASISGVVRAIKKNAIRIESDGKMERDPNLVAPEAHDLASFLEGVRKSGVVGLGGAAFPVWKKLDAARHSHIKTMLINGAECEPYITSDTRTMMEDGENVKAGVALLRKYLQVEEFIIGIESNKPQCIENMQKVFAGENDVKVLVLDSIYPQGAKQMILYNATGKVVEAGQRLASTGCLIINVTSLAKVGQFFTDGMPLVDRIITVDGSAVKTPCNLLAPLGTPVDYLLEQAGGLKSEAAKIIIGGPMMGRAVNDMHEPTVKATNAVLAFNAKDAVLPDPTACIRCGRCVEVCPMGLNPTALSSALELEDEAEKYAELVAEDVKLCMECGCCFYVCPAHRPLVQNNREGMQYIWKFKAASAEKKEGSK